MIIDRAMTDASEFRESEKARKRISDMSWATRSSNSPISKTAFAFDNIIINTQTYRRRLESVTNCKLILQGSGDFSWHMERQFVDASTQDTQDQHNICPREIDPLEEPREDRRPETTDPSCPAAISTVPSHKYHQRLPSSTEYIAKHIFSQGGSSTVFKARKAGIGQVVRMIRLRHFSLFIYLRC